MRLADVAGLVGQVELRETCREGSVGQVDLCETCSDRVGQVELRETCRAK